MNKDHKSHAVGSWSPRLFELKFVAINTIIAGWMVVAAC